jgi:hypothetical protein
MFTDDRMNHANHRPRRTGTARGDAGTCPVRDSA